SSCPRRGPARHSTHPRRSIPSPTPRPPRGCTTAAAPASGSASSGPVARAARAPPLQSTAVAGHDMDQHLRRAARDAFGFLPESEGLALYEVGRRAARLGPLLEIGSYCGKSAIYLGAAARAGGTVLFSV